MRAIFKLTSLGILLAAIGASAQTATPDVQTIVSRMQMAMAGRNHDRAYSVTREYTLAPEDASKASKVVAEVNTVPSGKSDYTITQGSGQAEKVVRKVLDHETDIQNQHSAPSFTPENYDFSYLGTEAVDGHRCYILQLTPRHDGKDMVNAKAWIDADSYLLRQLAGSPVKSPSWWIKDLQVVLHYSEIDGIWVQDFTQAIAQVRIAGKHTLTSRDLSVRSGLALASKSEPVKRTRHVDPALLGAGVFQNH